MRLCWFGFVVGSCALLAWAGASGASATEVVYARNLALSPDGRTLAFAWAGDLWSVSSEGGEARRLTVHAADDSNPVWSRDGRTIAFASDRHGTANVFLMSATGADVRRLTFSDRAEVPTDFSPDGAYVYFHVRKAGEVAFEPRVHRVSVEGGQDWRVLDCSSANARISPDGRRAVFQRGWAPWWRRGYRGTANHDLWMRDLDTGRFSRVTDWPGNDRDPAWDADGRGLYFLSDRGGDPQDDTEARPAGTVNVWYQPAAGGDARAVTSFAGDDVRDFSISADGKRLALARWDKVLVMDLPRGRPREIVIRATGDTNRNPVSLERFTSNADEIAVSPDGKEVALVVRGEIFVIKTEEGKLTRRVTDSPARDRWVTWSPDARALFFVSDRDGQERVYRALSAEAPPKPLSDSLRFKVEQVTEAEAIERYPAISPDGRKLAIVRGRGQLVIRDLASGDESVLVDSWNVPTFRWSPDSRWIAYEIEDAEHNPDLWIVPADGSAAAVNITQHPDYDGNPHWSADGQVLAFSSRREGMDSELYLVFLSPELDELSSVDKNEYFDAAGKAVKKRKPLKSAVASGRIALAGQAPPASKPASRPAREKPARAEKSEDPFRTQLRTLLKELLAEPRPEKKDEEENEKEEEKPKERKYAWDLASAYRRVQRVTSLPQDQSNLILSPDGSLLIFTSGHEGSVAVFSVKWNGQDRKRISTGGAGDMQWTIDGGRLFFLAGGKANSMTASGGDRKTHEFSAKMAIVYAEEAAQKFSDAARALKWGFYHPTMKGLDWDALTTRYRDLALRTTTYGEFNEICNLLQGELNASHQGTSGPGGRSVESVGYLGCEFGTDFAGPGLRVRSITPRSPADRAESRLAVGDVILSVNGRAVGPSASVEQALINTVGDPVVLTVRSAPRTAADGEAPSSTQPAAPPATQPATQPAEREVIIRPISYGAFSSLAYDAWVEANRRYVEDKSGGRLGYAHIQGMGEPQFHVFERDLYASGRGKDGLIIDRGTVDGGWTADWVMTVLSVRRHAFTRMPGGEPGYPQDRLIFYAWTKPATMMCNQYSYSNAEIVSHAFKNLGRGPLVGEETFGAVISTGSYGLIDGARIRMPLRGWFTLPDAKDMENNGATPTVRIPQTPEDEALGREPQLDAAIRVTLEELERQR